MSVYYAKYTEATGKNSYANRSPEALPVNFEAPNEKAARAYVESQDPEFAEKYPKYQVFEIPEEDHNRDLYYESGLSLGGIPHLRPVKADLTDIEKEVYYRLIFSGIESTPQDPNDDPNGYLWLPELDTTYRGFAFFGGITEYDYGVDWEVNLPDGFKEAFETLRELGLFDGKRVRVDSYLPAYVHRDVDVIVDASENKYRPKYRLTRIIKGEKKGILVDRFRNYEYVPVDEATVFQADGKESPYNTFRRVVEVAFEVGPADVSEYFFPRRKKEVTRNRES